MLDHLLRRVGRLEQVAGVRHMALQDGRSDNVRAVEVRNIDGLRALFIADRAMDMLSLEWRGIPVAWQSQNGVAAPQYYEPYGDDFLCTFFGGMLTTCGLTNFGPASEDHWGKVGLHGAINHVPAEDVWSTLNENEGYAEFKVHATVRQTRVFGENIRLDRTWSVGLEGSTVALSDRVTNDGEEAWPHMILYHCNVGHPLLSEALRLYVSHSTFRARDEAAQRGIEQWDRGAAPQVGFAEQVFVHTMRSATDGRAAALFANRDLELALLIRFSTEQLPYAFTWRMLGERTYVLAIEPANCQTIEGRAAAIRDGTLPVLQPGQTREYDLSFEIIDSSAEIVRCIRMLEESDARITPIQL